MLWLGRNRLVGKINAQEVVGHFSSSPAKFELEFKLFGGGRSHKRHHGCLLIHEKGPG